MGFLRRLFGRDIKTDTAVQNGYTLVADDTKTSGLDWSDVLIRGGLGRNLVTGINSLAGNSYNIDTVFLPGEYYFDIDTLGNRPCNYGLLKVWRESSAVVYQIVQSSDEANNRMFSRCYRNSSWGPWTEYASTSNIPSLSGYATETYVTNALGGYATETYVNNALPSLSGYATETYVNNALPLPAVLMGSVSSMSSFGGNAISSRYIKFHIVSPGGGGGGGHATQYYGPGGQAGNSGMALDILYIRNLGGPYTVSTSIGAAGAGGALGDIYNPPTDGQAGGDVTIDIDGISIVVYGGKGGLKGGGGTIGANTPPTPRSEPTINGNTVYDGGVYTFGNGTFIVKSIYHSYSSYGPSGGQSEFYGMGKEGVSPMSSHTGEGTPVPSPQSAPATAIGTSGAGGISEWGGFTATAGGTGGPGMVIVYR